jgi:hypothetical protein
MDIGTFLIWLAIIFVGIPTITIGLICLIGIIFVARTN